MQSMTHETETARDAEARLWQEYMSAEAKSLSARILADEAWRKHVNTRSDSTSSRWWALTDKCEELRAASKSAYDAWKLVAYPLNGWAVPVERGTRRKCRCT